MKEINFHQLNCISECECREPMGSSGPAAFELPLHISYTARTDSRWVRQQSIS